MDFELFIRMQKGRLNRLKHIKKYNHIRKIHREVIPSLGVWNCKKVYFMLKIGFSFAKKYATIYLYIKYNGG